MSEDIQNDEYKIVEPSNPRKSMNRQKEMIRKVQIADMIVRVHMMLDKDDDEIDSDSIFAIPSRLNKDICLLSKIPCQNPHCMSCHAVLMFEEDSERLLKEFSERYTKRLIKRFEQEASENARNTIKEIMDTIKKSIGDDKDGNAKN